MKLTEPDIRWLLVAVLGYWLLAAAVWLIRSHKLGPQASVGARRLSRAEVDQLRSRWPDYSRGHKEEVAITGSVKLVPVAIIVLGPPLLLVVIWWLL